MITPNDVIATNTFSRLLKRKSRKAPKELLKKIDDALLSLRKHPAPESLGIPKKGPLAGLLAYELDRENRILYDVVRIGEKRTVLLLRVCSHKEVYGKD